MDFSYDKAEGLPSAFDFEIFGNRLCYVFEIYLIYICYVNFESQ